MKSSLGIAMRCGFRLHHRKRTGRPLHRADRRNVQKRRAHTFVLGNIGGPITEHALETKEGDVVVAETAGLQLEGNVRFHARAAGVCNITEDHLDHFGTMENYIAAKCKIFDHQTADDLAFELRRRRSCATWRGSTPQKLLFFAQERKRTRGCSSVLRLWRPAATTRTGEKPLFRADEIRIPAAII